MALKFHDRLGNEISYETMESLFMDKDYCVVEQTTLVGYEVSTVWTPMRQQLFGNSLELFETAIFELTEHGYRGDMLSSQSAPTEQNAWQNHADTVAGLNKLIEAGLEFSQFVHYAWGERDELPDGIPLSTEHESK